MRLLVFLLFIGSSIIPFTSNAQFNNSEIESSLAQMKSENAIGDDDLREFIVTDNYTSMGITHMYFKQAFDGIEIYDSYGAIHGNNQKLITDASGIYKNINTFKLDRRTPSSVPVILRRIADEKDYTYSNDLTVDEQTPLKNSQAVFLAPSISQSPIRSRLVYYLQGKNELNLGRVVTIDDRNSPDYFEFLVDAVTGDIINAYNYTVYCDLGGDESHDHALHDHASEKNLRKSPKERDPKSLFSVAPNQYRVYEQPVESPLYGGQTDVTAPWLLNTTASPNGWHNIGTTDFTFTQGNNVDAYLDTNNSNGPTNGNADRASGGVNLEFLYDIDVNGDPVNFQEGALVNLFYWNNIIHDVWYNYGFDEASGNFQEENYGTAGAAGDYVQAEAQDGGGTCNANMATPADGGNPRMQMYLCNGRDGDLDNAVVVHEYVHGISNRLTGGPGAAGCLGNQEQMGEGWSDYYGLMMTIQPSDTSETLRPIGNWLVGQGANGGGIRSFPYTTDTNENPFTYDDIKTQSVPHGVGSVWCTMLWDMTWALIDEYGFDSDIYNGTGGNNMAMLLVTEGMKLQPCSPGFVDGRDAILAADVMHYGGANQCLIWQAFADRGLGASASQGSSGSRSDGTEAFDMPGTCIIGLQKTANVSAVDPGDNIIYTITAENNTSELQTGLVITDPLPANTLFVSASDGGSNVGGVVTFPAFDLAINGIKTVTFEVQVDPQVDPNIPDFTDDMESGASMWVTSNTGNSSFGLSTTQANSGTSSWFAADVTTSSVANLVTSSTLYLSTSSTLTFSHNYNTEVTYDGGVVEISQDNGATWIDLETNFTSNGYNSTINSSRPAFSGNSNGFITSVVDLSPFAGPALLRFQMNCDQAVGGVGWYIDDVFVDQQQLSIPNTAQILVGNTTYEAVLPNPTLINIDPNILSIETNAIDILCNGRPEGKAWVTASSGSGTYFYNWSTGAATDTIFNLLAGPYSVTVSDGITTKVSTVVVNEPDMIQVAMSSTDAPQGTGGTATATPSGGTPSYSYAWSNGGSTQTITGLVPGTYTVTVTDINLCSKINTVDVIDPVSCTDNLIQINIMMDQWPEDINLFVRDGTGNVIFQKSYDQTTGDGELVTEYVCVPDDCYEIEIDDEFGDGLCQNGNIVGFYEIIDGASAEVLFSGCDIGGGITLDLCYPLLTYSYATSEPSCMGLIDGAIDLTLVGGNPNPQITYSNGATTEDITGIGAGDYIVTITDGVRTYEDTIIIYDSKASVYVNNGIDEGSLYYAAQNACITDTIKFENVLMNDVVVVNQEVPLKDGHIVNGLGVTMITVSGNNTNRIFTIPVNGAVEIYNMTLRDGQSATDGGAIVNRGNLVLEDVLFINNYEGTTPKAMTNLRSIVIRGEVEIEE